MTKRIYFVRCICNYLDRKSWEILIENADQVADEMAEDADLDEEIVNQNRCFMLLAVIAEIVVKCLSSRVETNLCFAVSVFKINAGVKIEADQAERVLIDQVSADRILKDQVLEKRGCMTQFAVNVVATASFLLNLEMTNLYSVVAVLIKMVNHQEIEIAGVEAIIMIN